MAADMHIHILTDEFTESHARAFRSNCLNSKDFRLGYDEQFEKEHGCDLFEMAYATPNQWVGEVSWLKAALFEDNETFIPDPIGKVNEIIGEDFPMIDDVLIASVREAMTMPNSTSYTLVSGDEVVRFLEDHKGKRAFTISW